MSKIELEFENIRSNSEYLKRNYFRNIDKYHGTRAHLRDYVEEGIILMERDGVISQGDYLVSDDGSRVKVTAIKHGISLDTSFNTDFTKKTTLSVINPFGRGGEVGGEASVGLFKTLNGSIYYKDKYGNRIEFSKKLENPIELNKNLQIEENCVVFQPKNFGRHYFTLYAGDRRTFTVGENKDEEMRNHTGLSHKLSLTHRYYYFKDWPTRSGVGLGLGLWGRVNNEIAGGLFSTKFIRSETINHIYYPLTRGFNIECMFAGGALVNLSKGISPMIDRFYNGVSYHFKGFEYKGLATTKSKKPCLGGDFYHNTTFYLTKDIEDHPAQLFGYYSFGNSVLNYNNLGESIRNLFDVNNFRHSVGFGVRGAAGPALIDVYFAHVLKRLPTDETLRFGLCITLKFF